MAQKRFLCIDGIDGGGKSSQIQMLAHRLRSEGHRVVITREPGGSPIAERIRAILLQRENCVLTPEQEAVLFAAARADHVAKTILPSLADQAIVICDRFNLSTRVYQGVRGVPLSLLMDLEEEAYGNNGPAKTVIIDIPVEVSLERISRRAGATDLDFFEKQRPLIGMFRQRFLDEAAAEPGRIAVVDGNRGPQFVHEDVYRAFFGPGATTTPSP